MEEERREEKYKLKDRQSDRQASRPSEPQTSISDLEPNFSVLRTLFEILKTETRLLFSP